MPASTGESPSSVHSFYTDVIVMHKWKMRGNEYLLMMDISDEISIFENGIQVLAITGKYRVSRRLSDNVGRLY